MAEIPKDQSRQDESRTPSGAAARGFKRWYWLVLVALVVGIIEAFSYGTYWVIFGHPYDSETQAQVRRQVAAGSSAPEEHEIQARQLPYRIHPYLGFVYKINTNPEFVEFHRHPVNRFGFIDSNDSVQQRSPDKLIVGILGGSVAYWLSALGDQALIAEMHKHPDFRDREIVLVRMALGGFKQPQQLMALSYLLALGAQFDIVINIDGFNEVALPAPENVNVGVNPVYPRQWNLLSKSATDIDLLRLIGRLQILKQEREDFAGAFIYLHPLLKYSVTAQLVWKLRDHIIYSSIGKLSESIQRHAPGHTPGASEAPDAPLYPLLADVWMNASVQLHHLSVNAGIRYFHFLQPNQYLEGSKPLHEEELKTAYDVNNPYRAGVVKGYPELISRAGKLRDMGVDFHDLTQVFATQEEPLYIDTCCHLNLQGNEILARRIAQAIISATAKDASIPN